MLTGLEHGRGPSAPQGTVAGIVDAVGGAPGLTSLPASPVPSAVVPLLGGSSRGAAPDDVVQRSVRFDRPGGAVQRALSDLRGTSTVVQRAVEPSTGSGGSSSSSGVSGVSGSAPVGVSPTDPPSAADVGGGAAARAGTEPYGAGSSGSEPQVGTVRVRTVRVRTVRVRTVRVRTVRVRTIRRETVRRARRFRTICYQIVRFCDASASRRDRGAPRSSPSAPSPMPATR